MENNQVNIQKQNRLSIGGWIGTLIVLAIPVVGFIMLFVWGFGGDTTGRKNFCIATLILAAIGIVLSILLSLVFGFSMLAIFNNLY